MPIRPEFGQVLWMFLHSMAYIIEKKVAVLDHDDGGKKNRKDVYFRIEKSLVMLLPCSKCRSHYFTHIKRKDYNDIPNCDILAKLNFLHNTVNSLLNKQIYSLVESEEKSLSFIKSFPEFKNNFFKIILTLTKYWNKTSWYKKVNLHLRQELLNLVSLSLELIFDNYSNNFNEEIFSNYSSVYQTFTKYYDLDSEVIEDGFSYRTDGCECLNK